MTGRRLRLVVAPPAPLTPEEQAALHRARAALYAQLARLGRQVVAIDERLARAAGGR